MAAGTGSVKGWSGPRPVTGISLIFAVGGALTWRMTLRARPCIAPLDRALQGRAVRPKRQNSARLAVLIALLISVSAPLPRFAAQALPPPTEPVTGNATWFEALGSPYGGCGLPQSALDSQDFVALNVYNTPGDYSFYPRPIPESMADKIGMFDNGRNCGRWLQVTVGDFCTGVNDGAPNQPF
jgi:hypothetical protein